MDNKDIIQELVNSLGEQRSVFLNDIESSIKSYISSQGTNCLTINQVYSSGEIKRQWKLKASSDYAKCLYAFCRRESFRGYELDSALTEPVVDIVTSKFEAFYQKNNEHINKAFLKALIQDSAIINSIVEKIVEKALKNKGSKYLGQQITSAVTTKITSLIIAHIHDVVHSQAGEASAHTIKHAMASGVALPIVKTIAIVIVKLLSMHIGAVLIKALSTVAFKATVAVAVKKFLVVVLLATIVKAIAAKLSISAGAVFAVVLIPLILAYIVHEINTFPAQLGEKVAAKVREELDSNFDKTNKDIIGEIFKELPNLNIEGIATDIANSAEVQNHLDELINHLVK